MSNLFREEAIQEAQSHLKGDLSIVQPSALSFFLYFLLLLLITTIAFLSLATFERQFTAQGFIHPSGFSNEIFTPETGYISKLLIKEGSVVAKGELLGIITKENFGPDGKDTHNATIQNRENKLNQLQSELAKTKEQYELSITQIKNKIKHSATKLQLKLSKAENLDKRLNLSLSNIKQLETLTNDGYISQLSLLEYKDKHLELTHLSLESDEDIYTEKEKTFKLPMELKLLNLKKDNEISALVQEIQENKLSLLVAQSIKATELRAPSSGKITSLNIKQDQSVRENTRLYTVIPEDGELQGVIYIPSKDFGFVKIGQQLKVRYSAFPHDVYGSVSGQLSTLGENISMPHEIEIPNFINQSAYRATIKLDSQIITFNGDALKVKAGMSFEADIILEEQSLIKWVLGPVWAHLGNK